MKNLISYLVFGNGRQIKCKAAWWHISYSCVNALQFAVMLLLVRRFCGIENGGIFAIAYTTSQLMYTIGSYSFRNFHATDTCQIYSYKDYSRARFLTCTAMAVISVAYCWLRQYDATKTKMVLIACILKLIEAVENLYHGELQRGGRLDIAGRTGAFRFFLNDVAFLLVLLLTQNMLLALISAVITTLLVTVTMRKCYGVLFLSTGQAGEWTIALRLLLECLPLFISGMLSIYISDAGKYAVDIYLGNEAQTYFSVIFMPVFAINMLSSMIYYPKITQMAELWNVKKFDEFRCVVFQQVLIIVACFMAVALFGVLIGLRLLGLIYKLSLNSLIAEFVVLLVGGGFVALYNYMYACITIMRHQNSMLALSSVSAVVALLLSNIIVPRFGLTGTCWLYLLLMFLEAVGSAGFAYKFYQQATKNWKGERKK